MLNKYIFSERITVVFPIKGLCFSCGRPLDLLHVGLGPLGGILGFALSRSCWITVWAMVAHGSVLGILSMEQIDGDIKI